MWPSDPPGAVRWLVAGALVVDASAGWLLNRAAASDSSRASLVFPTILAFVVAGTAVLVVVRPSALVLTIARGVAAAATWCVVLLLILLVLGYFFNPQNRLGWEEPALIAAMTLQVAIFEGTRRMDGADVPELLRSTAAGLALVVLGVVVAYVVAQILLVSIAART